VVALLTQILDIAFELRSSEERNVAGGSISRPHGLPQWPSSNWGIENVVLYEFKMSPRLLLFIPRHDVWRRLTEGKNNHISVHWPVFRMGIYELSPKLQIT